MSLQLVGTFLTVHTAAVAGLRSLSVTSEAKDYA